MSSIGSYHLHSIETGRFGLDGGAMFGIVPKPLWQRKISADELNRIPLNARCLLMEGNGQLILVDNGIGDKYNEKFGSIYAIDDESENLDASLKQLGFEKDDITDVILTHLHFDHCGGSTRLVNGKPEVAFRNATFHVQKAHWDWAAASNVREKASFLDENLHPLGESGQLNLIEGSFDLFPGIEVIPVDGHTLAMQLVRVHDEHHSVLFTADLLPTHAHLSPAWNMGYDLWPMTTITEKAKILERATNEGWHLFFEHDPVVSLSNVTQGNRGLEIAHPRPLTEL
ncbi:MAG: MBL fold metallo-hydrolase [Bacteroidetes Order II. Incertae sedis bacterium]|jgi:glyoxylase-like metal-dependent hydrolase (beta-lactamase superfamily II)|nr:MBL fold metallo-hydrolase [Bacteroidetes Order II. bacterium]MBT4603674.1 MBL fold metallo-hydrolase [Bacteroidetes Order II. bacterium]MBT5248616.1 MBL fold metallo-hydrolase [Bacteroidetes Order II. bacterium]MBT6200395.1 MBL fold metallo-hydrolase [Bacteroidetes Order II. bacterium]MBT6425247.1 MBL fold metallo-hydrolase [Bacteroidetes Order II. bacterium]